MTKDKPQAREPFEFFESPWWKDMNRKLCVDGWPLVVVSLNCMVRHAKSAYDQLLAENQNLRDKLTDLQRVADGLEVTRQALEAELKEQWRINGIGHQVELKLRTEKSALEAKVEVAVEALEKYKGLTNWPNGRNSNETDLYADIALERLKGGGVG